MQALFILAFFGFLRALEYIITGRLLVPIIVVFAACMIWTQILK
jgi:hypothetical protein